MVVVAGAADANCKLAVGPSDCVDLALLGQALQVAVNGRQSNASQVLVQLLSGQRRLVLPQRLKDCPPLLGLPGCLLVSCSSHNNWE